MLLSWYFASRAFVLIFYNTSEPEKLENLIDVTVK